MTGSHSSIPFNVPYLVGSETKAIAAALEQRHLSGDGPFTKAVHKWFEERLGCETSVMTPSCSLALDLAMLIGGVGPGDEVIVPDFTFVTTAQCVALRGATPVFCDVRPDTLNIDEARLEAAITPRTRAIVPVHYAGVVAEMDTVNAIAAANGLLVVEDAAQAIGCTYKGKPAGSLGDMAAFSFHATKNVQCGEGGLLAINNPAYSDAAHIAWEKGTDRRQFLEGRIDKYQWKSLGTSFVPSEINAAMLTVQLEEAEAINARRRQLWERYHEAFMAQEQRGVVRRPDVPVECIHNGHLYFLILPDKAKRDALLRELASAGIAGAFHYVPLHSSEGGTKYGRKGGDLANSTELSSRLIRLPLFADLSEDQQDRVIGAVDNFLHRL